MGSTRLFTFRKASDPSAQETVLGVDPVFNGWLFKLGNPGRWNEGWRRRWFVLDGTVIRYYADAGKLDANVAGAICQAADEVIANTAALLWSWTK